MRARRIAAMAALLMLAGCTATSVITGQVQQTGETFTGRAVGHMDGAGEIGATTSKGVPCQGTFTYVTKRQGQGVFSCADGRSGPFQFVSTGSRGSGQGNFGNGQSFIFTTQAE